MTRVRVGILTVLVTLALVASWQFLFKSEESARLQTESGRRFKSFELRDRNHKNVLVNLTPEKNETVILHFWASWCPPCIGEIKDVLETAKKMADFPIRWVFVGAADQWEAARKHLPDSNLSSKIISVMDPDLKTIESFGTFQYPETYFYSADGVLIKKWVGAHNWKEFDPNQWINK